MLTLAQAMKLVRLGKIALDGTKIKANASKHKALSQGHIAKLEAQLRESGFTQDDLNAIAWQMNNRP